MLAAESVTKRFGGLVAVDEVTLSIDEEEVVGLMGPNGSGKSTFVNCLTGVHTPTSGTIRYHGEDITGREMYRNARDGIARTFQEPRIFDDLTVLKNVEVPLLNTARSDEEIEELAREHIEAMDLAHVVDQKAKELSGGQKKLMEFARNLMRDPDVILMDEPFAGVHPEIKRTMFDRITERNDAGTEFLVVSHEVDSLYTISDRIVVFDRGARIASGSPDEVQQNDRVVEAYLGEEVPA